MRGRDLAMVRKRAGVTQDDLARVSGISRPTLVDIERERVVPQMPSIEDLAANVQLVARTVPQAVVAQG